MATAQQEPLTATVQVVCAEYTQVESVIKEYAEIPVAIGLTTRGTTSHPFVLYINPVTGSWTLVEKTPNELYCVMAVGDNFGPVPEENRKELQKNHDKQTI